MTTPVGPQNNVHVSWRGEHRFEAAADGRGKTVIDGDSTVAQTPPEILLSAAAACSGIDVVDILAKRRTPVASLEIDATGQRRATHPRRFLAMELVYHITGEGIERAQAERAVLLGIEKYCTVISSLAADIELHSVVVLNGERGAPVRHPITT